MRRRAPPTLLVLLAAALSGPVSCGGEREARAPTAEARTGGTAVVGGMGEIPTVNPLVSTDYVAEQVQRHVLFTTLVRFDEELRPRPYLARSWELSPDSSEIVFRLREGVRWHDGEALTAADVAFTFRRAKDPEVGYPRRSYFTRWDSVEVVDRTTVRFHLEPTAGFLYAWRLLPILPEHVLGDVPPGELGGHPFGTREAVGSGPFRFVEHAAGDRWVFRANTEFPEAMGGRPRLDRLVYRVVPDATTLLAELRSGEVDFFLRVPPEHREAIREDEDLRAVSFAFPGYAFVAWNTRRPLFEEARVRRALTMAIDRDEMLEVVRRGLGSPANGPVGPWHWAHDPTQEPLPHDPDSARALLAAGGWRDRDGDGVREKDGREFRFDLSTNPSRLRRDIAVMIQDDLAGVGVQARPRAREYASLSAAVTGPERDFDAVILSWSQDLVFDDRPLWACDRMDAPYQFTGYCDPRLDAVLDSIPRALDREQRGRLLRRYNRLVYRDQPYTFLYFQKRLDGLRRSLRGVRMDARGELITVSEWWIERPAR